MSNSVARISPPLAIVLLISTAIAWITPFDVAFAAATFGFPWLRVGLMALIALVGASFASKLDLKLSWNGRRYPALLGIAAAAATALYVVAIDCWVFRKILPTDYVNFLHSSLQGRLIYFMTRAFNENVLYRLFLFTGLTYAVFAAKGREAITPTVLVIAMAVSQSINIGLNVVALSHEPLSVLQLVYDALRYVVPGMFWAWLFWRFGFMIAEVASVGCHLFLQPMIGVLL
jgi:hypothetical protein